MAVIDQLQKSNARRDGEPGPWRSSPDGSGIQDLGLLYRQLSGPLEGAVRRAVRSSDVVVEDACQFAWSRLVHHRARVSEETAMGWLTRTAIHEAFKLSRRR